MSGGHYDYAFGRVRDLADAIYDDIASLSTQTCNDYGEIMDAKPPAVLEAMKRCASALENASVAARDVEWYMSYDYGDETLLKAAKEWKIPERTSE